MKTTIAVLAVSMLLLCSCSSKITLVKVCPEVGEGGYLDIDFSPSESPLTTTTDQKTDGRLDATLTPTGGL